MFGWDAVAVIPGSDGIQPARKAQPFMQTDDTDSSNDVTMASHGGQHAFCISRMQVPFASADALWIFPMEPGDRLREARERAGYDSAKAAAEAMGIPYATYSQHESKIRGIPAGRAERYGRFFRVAPEWLLYGHGDIDDSPAPSAPIGMRQVTRMVPVVGVIQAGVFAEALEDLDEPEVIPIHLAGFEGAQLFALRVRGRSMDRFYPDGTMVIICPAVEIGVREGDHVVVRRRRGNLVETTLKEVVKEKGAIALWPRSSDPQFQDPIRLELIRDADEGPEIIGVVVSSYTIRPIQNRPLLQL